MTVVALLLTCAALQAPLSGPPCPSAPSLRQGDRCPGVWGWPLRPVPPVLRAFEPPARPWAPGHRGVDLGARPGQAVYAAGPGQISYAARLAGRGVVAIAHGSLRTTYLPVRPSVPVGRQVERGDRIGTVEGRPGHCGGSPCLHWGARDGLGYTDPLALLGRRPIRLLPIWGTPGPRGAEVLPSSPAADPRGGPDVPDGPAGREHDHLHDHPRGHLLGSDDPPGVRPRPLLVAAAAASGGGAVLLLSPAFHRPLRRALRRRALAGGRAAIRAGRPRLGGGPGGRSP
ncbi:MAG TPA: M23 family metallopeptidase [Actinomadura sp.]|nr:M23 family metallopeptidase [Actinomadura sp.]